MTARLQGWPAREAAAWGLVVLVAAALRLPGLGDPPLAPQEASSAVIAWQAARGQGTPPPSDPSWSDASPLQASAQLALFALGDGGGETTARLPSALAGIGLVLLLLPLRRRLGAETALVLAALVALDPACVEASRRADGAAIAALVGAAAVVARPRGPVAAACLGLLLAAGSAAWTLLPVVLLAVLLGQGPRVTAVPLQARMGIAAAAALAGSSGLLGAWDLVGGVSTTLTAWLEAWSRAVATGPAPRLGSVTPLAMGLGVIGVLCLGRARRFALLAVLLASASWTVLVALRPGGDPCAVLLASLLLTAAAVPAVAEIRGRWTGAAGLLSPRTAVASGLLAALALPGLVKTARLAAGGPGESSPARSAGVRLLAEDVMRVSSERAGDAHELAVEVLCQPRPDPLLRWTLREARTLRFHTGGLDPRDSGPSLVVGPDPSAVSEVPCDPPRGRAGARYQAGASPVVLWVPRER